MSTTQISFFRSSKPVCLLRTRLERDPISSEPPAHVPGASSRLSFWSGRSVLLSLPSSQKIHTTSGTGDSLGSCIHYRMVCTTQTHRIGLLELQRKRGREASDCVRLLRATWISSADSTSFIHCGLVIPRTATSGVVGYVL